jgi:hypothetical protein
MVKLTKEQLTELAKHIRERFYELKKENKGKEPPHELLVCAQQLDAIKKTPFMLESVMDMVDWSIAGEDINRIPLMLKASTPLLTLEIAKWRLTKGI